MESKKIHLVCSGGGVKCFSYVGAIQKLLESKMDIASVSACSMGTVLAALVCSGKKIEEIEQAILNFNFKALRTQKSLFFISMFRYPYASHRTPEYSTIMGDLIGSDITLGEMVIPFSAAALDLRQKRFLVYSSETHQDMRISEVIKIATAIPLMYEPYKLGNRVLVDAAVASESPVWMAANNPGFYPIVVLKPASSPDESYRKGYFNFLSHLFSASTSSHDYFAATQTSRAIEISINCGNIGYADLKIKREQIENLIIQGQSAAEIKLRESNNNFNHILDIEEVNSSSEDSNAENKAEVLASQMITGFQKEIYKRNQVFISYSRKDKKWLERFQAYMKSIERFTGVKTWDDTVIKGGANWNKEIEGALMTTKIAVFLVTQNFLASDFIQDTEMKYFLEVSARENVPILWVAVSDSLFTITPLNDIQCANDPKKPLDTLSEAEQNAEITSICKTILERMDGRVIETRS